MKSADWNICVCFTFWGRGAWTLPFHCESASSVTIGNRRHCWCRREITEFSLIVIVCLHTPGSNDFQKIHTITINALSASCAIQPGTTRTGWHEKKWVSDWVSERVSEWVRVSESEWVSERVSESEWVSERASEWVRVSEWAREWVSEREWVREWVSEWVSERVSEWVLGFYVPSTAQGHQWTKNPFNTSL